LKPIQTATSTVWVMRKRGVPKKRAKISALRPNQSPPKAELRWTWGAWKRRWWPELCGEPAAGMDRSEDMIIPLGVQKAWSRPGGMAARLATG
jgi:hypothetical protein